MNDSNHIHLFAFGRSFRLSQGRQSFELSFCMRVMCGLRPSVLVAHRQRMYDRLVQNRRLARDSDSEAIPMMTLFYTRLGLPRQCSHQKSHKSCSEGYLTKRSQAVRADFLISQKDGATELLRRFGAGYLLFCVKISLGAFATVSVALSLSTRYLGHSGRYLGHFLSGLSQHLTKRWTRGSRQIRPVLTVFSSDVA